MGQAIAVRRDFTSEEVRQLAKRAMAHRGKTRMLTPDIILNNSPESWTVPPFGAPKFSFPGLALA